MMYRKIILLAFISFQFVTCGKNEKPNSENLYRYFAGQKENFSIWIVDGSVIRNEIFGEFLYGGNNQRYPFVPKDEIWIDNSISSEEYETTLLHEINENNLMMNLGYTYFDAHDSSLNLEQKLRKNYVDICFAHEKQLPYVIPMDFDSTIEIETLPDSIRLENVYKVPFGENEGYKVWVVDGFKIRRDIYPDFGFSGNYLAYKFIPNNEIWIDASMSCEELMYSIFLETNEIKYMKNGLIYDDAYTKALNLTDNKRKENKNKVISQKPIIKTDPVFRDTGVKNN